MNEKEYEFVPAFGHPGLLVNRLGVLKESETQALITVRPARQSGTYPSFSFNGKKDNVHRVVAETFLPKDSGDMIVNHLDGDKTNNSAENLEWVTHSRNSEHAYETGLRSENIPILIKDLRTHEVRRFYSYGDAARTLKCTSSRIFDLLLPKRRGKVFDRYFLITKEGDQWPSYNEAEVGTNIGNERKRVVARNVNRQNCVYVFASITDAAESIGLKPKTLTMTFLRGKRKHKRIIEVAGWVLQLEDAFMSSGFRRFVERFEAYVKNYPQKRPPACKRFATVEESEGNCIGDD